MLDEGKDVPLAEYGESRSDIGDIRYGVFAGAGALRGSADRDIGVGRSD
jgi:hypothetical protein